MSSHDYRIPVISKEPEVRSGVRRMSISSSERQPSLPTCRSGSFSGMKQWPVIDNERRINDPVYGCVVLPSPLEKIIDTEEFQRLRNLKQTGLVHLVYPGCEHTRFVHSLGTFYLAYKLMDRLIEREKYLNITSSDHLCVCIAALLHDIGHGPFSHMFDGAFARRVNGDWKHEEMSLKIIRRLLIDNESVRTSLQPFLGEGSEYEQNVTFICEMVKPGKIPPLNYGVEFDIKRRQELTAQEWWAKGRPIEKSFMYDIVSNSYNSHDVDKMDYLLRDSKASGVPISLSYVTIRSRIFDNVRVAIDPHTGLRTIGYSKKVADDIKSIGDSRQELHSKVYQHKSVIAIETMMVDALTSAAHHLSYKGSDGNMYNLSQVINNTGAFLRTNDSIEFEIFNSSKEELTEAREILRKIQLRDIPKKIWGAEISPRNVQRVMDKNNGGSTTHDVEHKVRLHILENKLIDESILKALIIRIRELGKGLDESTHPIQRQVFFDKKTAKQGKEPIGFFLEDEYAELNIAALSTKWEILVMGDNKLNEDIKNQIKKAFTETLRTLNIVTPQKRQRADSERPEHTPAKRSLNQKAIVAT